jgi:hypothetical protein
VLDGRDIAFTLQNPNQFYWAIDLAGGQALYLQLNATMNDPVQQPLAAFLEGVLERVAATQPRYAIVDFRSNLGGSYQLPAEFTRELPKRMPQNGRIFILTSANTYSAGVVTTARLKYFSGSRGEIVGEPMGDYSQFWAEAATRIVLPNSGLRVGYATGFHDWENGCSLRQLFVCYPANYLLGVPAGDLDPTMPVSWTFTDYLESKDTAIERIKHEISMTW